MGTICRRLLGAQNLKIMNSTLLQLLVADLLPHAGAALARASECKQITIGTLTSILPPKATADPKKLRGLLLSLRAIFASLGISITQGPAEAIPEVDEVELITRDSLQEEVHIPVDTSTVGSRQTDLSGHSIIEVTTNDDGTLPEEELALDVTDSTWLSFYMKIIRRYPLLNPGQEYALGLSAQRGDEAAINTLTLHNLRYGFNIARKFVNRGVALEDLVQEANLALRRAAADYNPKTGRFTTYATWWIRQMIHRYIQDHASDVRYPNHLHESRQRIHKIEEQMVIELGRIPSKEEVRKRARHLSDLDQTLCMIEDTITHLDTTIDLGEGTKTVQDYIADRVLPNPVLSLDASEQLDEAAGLIRGLVVCVKELEGVTDISQERFFRYYGLNGYEEGLTLEKVGAHFGVTREAIRHDIVKIWDAVKKRGGQFTDTMLARTLNRIYELEKIVGREARLMPD